MGPPGAVIGTGPDMSAGQVRASAHAHVTYRCGDCGHEVAKWVGRCPECQSWGSVAAAGAGR